MVFRLFSRKVMIKVPKTTDILQEALRLIPKNIKGHRFNENGWAYNADEINLVVLEYTMSPLQYMELDELAPYAHVVAQVFPDIYMQTHKIAEPVGRGAVVNLAYVARYAVFDINKREALRMIKDYQYDGPCLSVQESVCCSVIFTSCILIICILVFGVEL
jgi:hypothetical protein